MSAKRKASTIYTDWWGRRWGQGPEKAEVRATQEQSLKKNKPESKGTKKYTQFKQKDTEMRDSRQKITVILRSSRNEQNIFSFLAPPCLVICTWVHLILF